MDIRNMPQKREMRIQLMADVVAAYVSNNPVPVENLPTLSLTSTRRSAVLAER